MLRININIYTFEDMQHQDLQVNLSSQGQKPRGMIKLIWHSVKTNEVSEEEEIKNRGLVFHMSSIKC